MAFSFWERFHFENSWDLLIVGGGFAGLNSALEVKRRSPGSKVGILEAGCSSFGASTRNAGFCCFGGPSEVLRDIRDQGEEAALSTMADRWKGMERIRSLFKPERIAYEGSGGHELFFDPSLYEDVLSNMEWLNKIVEDRIGFAPYGTASDGRSITGGIRGMKGEVRILGEGMLNPYLLHKALTDDARNAGIELYYGVRVKDLNERGSETEVWTEAHSYPLRAAKTLIACNGFTEELLPGVGIEPGRGQVLITDPLDEVPFRGSFHMDQGNFYFRNVGDRVLLGGGRENAPEEEKTLSSGTTDRIQDELERLLDEQLLSDRSYRIEERWSGIMGFTEARYPLLKPVSDRIFLMGGFSGMGVALTFATSERMAELLLR